MNRVKYYKRIFSAYVLRRRSQLTFWHEAPARNELASYESLGPYYMTFADKADYPGPFDDDGIPILDYHGAIGLQHNPIAIAQYGLANFNLYATRGGDDRRRRYVKVSDWLVANLEKNDHGLPVWNHHFDWEYRDTLRAPWYSGLAQGQGISMLVRAHSEEHDERYLQAATDAFEALTRSVDEGGVTVVEDDRFWIEEYLVDPPTHILNGFIWASWGLYDYWLATKDPAARELFDRSVETLAASLELFDSGYWSRYDLPGNRLPNPASAFYHRLHVVQLEVMHGLTGRDEFEAYRARWAGYGDDPVKRRRAAVAKALFKLVHY